MNTPTIPSNSDPSNIARHLPRRVKPIETCDNCKQRKVRCDKERPQCGTCRKSNRECTYDFSASSKRGRPKSEVEILQEQIEDIQTIQFQQLGQMETLLEMAVMNDPGTSSVNSVYGNFLNQNGIEQNQDHPLNNDGLYGWNGVYTSIDKDLDTTTSLNQIHSEETLHSFTELAAKLPKRNLPTRVRSGYPEDGQDPMDQLVEQLNNDLNLESTRYVGPDSLLLMNNFEEQIIPQEQDNLSSIELYLKVLPNPEIVDCLIDIYFRKICRHYPHLRKNVVLDCLKDLSRPQHFLLLNSIFFAASPFHPDENFRNGWTYHERAQVLLQRHCLIKPHVLTVVSLFILGLHTRKTGAAWVFHGMGTKMAFELGLHRKIKNRPDMKDQVKEMRDMAFWGAFIAETWVSACYGRPSAMDESVCDVDLLPLPSDPEPDEETRLNIAWVLHINLLRIFSQVRKYLSSRKKFLGSRREGSQFRFLDAALGKWFHTLPNWLKFDEMARDVKGSFLDSIGGEMHTLFWTVLIFLHSRNLTMFTINPNNSLPLTNNSLDDSSRQSSQAICVHAATILLHMLDVLVNLVPDFYEQSCGAVFAFAPAIRILSWVAQRGDKKAESMVERLKEIKEEVKEIARRRFVEGRLDGEEKLKQGYANEAKRDTGHIIPETNQYKDYSQIKKRDTKNRQKQKMPMWGEDSENFTFTFSMDNFDNENSQSTSFQYGPNVAQHPQMLNLLYNPQTIAPTSSSSSMMRTDPQVFYTTQPIGFSNPPEPTNSNDNFFSFATPGHLN